VNGWAFRVKRGLGGCWAEVGVSGSNTARVVVRTGSANGLQSFRTSLSVEQARALRRALSRAIREAEAAERASGADVHPLIRSLEGRT
jgi:hypothetical protein